MSTTALAFPPQRLRLTLDDANLDFHKVEPGDVFDTIGLLYGGHDGRLFAPLRRARADRRSACAPPRRTGCWTNVRWPRRFPPTCCRATASVVELGDVVNVTAETASFPIFRHNGKPAEMVTAELAGAFEAPLYGQIAVGRAIAAADWGDLPKPRIVQHGQPEDTSTPVLLWDGEWDVTWVTFRDMGAAFGVALVGIYILVVMQFGSFKLPLVVLTPVPLTLIGILFGHWLFGAPFSATSMIGFIALAGIIVRNSILLVDFIRHSRGDGRPLLDVLLEAGSIRFKPILLTALAAMIGAVTILTDPIFQGLAISLLFGLLSSTILTVLVIPAIYVTFRGGRDLTKKDADGMTNGSDPNRAAGSTHLAVGKATSFLKLLAHEGRLEILCLLVDGGRTVGEIGGQPRPQPIRGLAATHATAGRRPRRCASRRPKHPLCSRSPRDGHRHPRLAGGILSTGPARGALSDVNWVAVATGQRLRSDKGSVSRDRPIGARRQIWRTRGSRIRSSTPRRNPRTGKAGRGSPLPSRPVRSPSTR